jgi:hypothetical protein
VPFFGDQFFWGELIHARGVGPAPIRVTELTTEGLSNAIRFMLDPEVALLFMLLFCSLFLVTYDMFICHLSLHGELYATNLNLFKGRYLIIC